METHAPEALLAQWLGGRQDVVQSAVSHPIIVPYDRLSGVDGWIVWLGHPPVPDGLSLLPAPEALLWDRPETAIAVGLLVAADYAIRRGARDQYQAARVLERECPIAIVVPEPIHSSIAGLLTSATDVGVPVVSGAVASMAAIAESARPFNMRRAAHQVDLGRRHDPAYSFQVVQPDVTIGDNPQSSFVLHDSPENDGVSVFGEMSERIGIDIGVAGPGISFESTGVIEEIARVIPAFLNGIAVSMEGERLVIGWQEDDQVDPRKIGESFRTWLKGMLSAHSVDVRITFIDESNDVANSLGEFRARAASVRKSRQIARQGGEFDSAHSPVAD